MAGGGGGQTSTTKSEFPPEFRPLATSAVGEIQELQSALPLRQFADPNPRQVPGLARFQSETLNLLPNTLRPTQGLQQLQGLPIDPTGRLGIQNLPTPETVLPGFGLSDLDALRARLQAPPPTPPPVAAPAPAPSPVPAPAPSPPPAPPAKQSFYTLDTAGSGSFIIPTDENSFYFDDYGRKLSTLTGNPVFAGPAGGYGQYATADTLTGGRA